MDGNDKTTNVAREVVTTTNVIWPQLVVSQGYRNPRTQGFQQPCRRVEET